MWTVHGCTSLGNLGPVRPKRIVKKKIGLWLNSAVAKYSIAVLAVQSPLGHFGDFPRDTISRFMVTSSNRFRVFKIEQEVAFL